MNYASSSRIFGFFLFLFLSQFFLSCHADDNVTILQNMPANPNLAKQCSYPSDLCNGGQYCKFDVQAARGICVDAKELFDIARAEVLKTLAVDPQYLGRATLSEHFGLGSLNDSRYRIHFETDNAEVCAVHFKLSGALQDNYITSVVPENVRSSAPWGNSEYVMLGQILVYMPGSLSRVDVDSQLSDLLGRRTFFEIEDFNNRTNGSNTSFSLRVTYFQEVEIALKLNQRGNFKEAWPNRLLLLSHNAAGFQPKVKIAELDSDHKTVSVTPDRSAY